MNQFCQEDPAFDTGNDAHFKKAVKTINIYQMKIDFLIQKGYKAEWGCPNEVCFLCNSGVFEGFGDL